MARRKIPERKPYFDDLSNQTKQAIGAVGFLILAVFFSLALLGYAGIAGEWAYTALDFMFGGGAYIAPLICVFYIYALLNPKDDENVSTSKIIGIALMFLMLLTGLSLYERDLGGMMGLMFEYPITYLVGPIAGGFVAGALFVIGIFLTFDTGLHLSTLFKKKELVEDEIDEEITPDITKLGDPVPEAAEDHDDDEDEEEQKPEEKTIFKMPSLGGSKDPFTQIAYSGPYTAPPLSLLARGKGKARPGDAKANANIIKQTLKNFGVEVEMDQVEIGPTVSRYALKPAQGVKLSRIVNLQRELELNLGGLTIRIEAPIPGKSLVGIEVPNIEKATIGLASLLSSPDYTDSPHPLLVALGKDITGKAHFANIARMPHGLIAGTTGSGKSVMIHNLIVSLLYRNSPEQLRLVMVDPKRVELTLYNGIPHLMTSVITDAKKALMALKWAVGEMERRLEKLQEHNSQNIAIYHKKVYHPAKEKFDADKDATEEDRQALPESMPYIVVIMDELADLMHAYPRELEASIVRLAQMSRATGIHLVLATQRPSVNVITGTIKANIPTRIAFKVASQIDSRTILDQAGAEKLLGQGDMLFSSEEYSKPIRLQSAYVSGDEVDKVVEHLKGQGDLQVLDSIDLEAKQEGAGDAFWDTISGGGDDEDELYEDAKRAVLEAGKASTSYLQRKLRIGYSRAARLIDILEERGVISGQDGSKSREIIAGGDSGNDDASPDTEGRFI